MNPNIKAARFVWPLKEVWNYIFFLRGEGWSSCHFPTSNATLSPPAGTPVSPLPLLPTMLTRKNITTLPYLCEQLLFLNRNIENWSTTTTGFHTKQFFQGSNEDNWLVVVWKQPTCKMWESILFFKLQDQHSHKTYRHMLLQVNVEILGLCCLQRFQRNSSFSQKVKPEFIFVKYWKTNGLLSHVIFSDAVIRQRFIPFWIQRFVNGLCS